MASEKVERGFFSWLMWLVLGELVLITVLTPMLGKGGVEWVVRMEREWSLAQVGYDATLWVERSGRKMYEAMLIGTGVERNVYEFFLPDGEVGGRGLEALGANLWFPAVKSGLDSVFAVVLRLLVRSAALSLWLPAMPLILTPAILDGMMIWRCKQYSFDYASPLVHGFAATTAKWIVLGLPVILTLPLPIPPLLYPGVFIALAMLLMTIGAHTQKRI